MKLLEYQDLSTMERTFKLTFGRDELARARITDFDRLLLEDCSGEDATIADKVLAMELIARRIEEAEALGEREPGGTAPTDGTPGAGSRSPSDKEER